MLFVSHLRSSQYIPYYRKEDAMKCLKEAFVKAQQTRVPVDECQKIAAKAVVGQTIETS